MKIEVIVNKAKGIIEMRNTSILFLVFFLVITALSSCKKESNVNVTVVRDCTGTYLRWDGKDYQVCNLEKVSSFSNGRDASATFRKITECKGSAKDAAVCYLLHKSEGWIEVCKIK